MTRELPHFGTLTDEDLREITKIRKENDLQKQKGSNVKKSKTRKKM